MKQTLGWPGAIALITLMAVFSMATAAQNMYRWVDADGNVHYSDQRPPAGAKDAKSIKRARTNSDENTEGAVESTSYVDKEADFQERQQNRADADAKAKQEVETAALSNKNCDISRNNLETLTNPVGGRLRETNAEGVIVYVSEEERQRQMAQARQDVNEWCKS